MMTDIAALFERLASASLRMTLTLFVNGKPAMVGSTVIVIVADDRLPNVPKLHVTRPLVTVHVPWLDTAEINVASLGSVFVTNTPVDELGPALSRLIE